jgi:hypothetical protein
VLEDAVINSDDFIFACKICLEKFGEPIILPKAQEIPEDIF